uniref:Proline rich membrane anchor 1 n=1 Tax=Cyclopterus lumpus TaxID=8103 RepID=A0A8C2ZCF6_CYCLU
MCNVICLSFQVHPRTLLGAACCPLCWWVASYRERAAAIDGELQRSCSQTVAEKVSEQCQLACHCRRYPPLPPPPPPPPPPRLLVAEPMVPLLRPWWMEMDIVVLGTVGCASVVFLLSAIIICYKAIKRYIIFAYLHTLWHKH